MAHPRWRELQALAEADDLDGVLSIATVDEVAEAWLGYKHRDHTYADDEEDPDWWAVVLLLDNEVYQRDGLCRDLLEALVAHATTDDLGAIAAGPLENFASDNVEDLEWLEQRAAASEKWRAAIAGMWIADYVSEETLHRLDRAAGTLLSRPTPRSEWPPEVLASTEAEERLVAIAGSEWYLLEDPTPEQQHAMSEFLEAARVMLEQASRPDEAEPPRG